MSESLSVDEIAQKSLNIYSKINDIQKSVDTNSDSYKKYKELGFEVDNKDKDEDDMDFYTREIKSISRFFENGGFSRYPTLTKYLVALNSSEMKKNKAQRVIVGGKKVDSCKLRQFFSIAFDPLKMPDAKWPSNYSPYLMQQLAVNVARNQEFFSDIYESDNKNVFSVNGPPGTGKTTLLKELVADSVVKRALAIRKLDNLSDKAFDKYEIERFKVPYRWELINKKGEYITGLRQVHVSAEIYNVKKDLLNDGIIVISNSNKAVENVSLDLPKDDNKIIRNKLKEYQKELNSDFDFFQPFVEEYYKKIGLSTEGGVWGLISVPFGNGDNLLNVYEHLLLPILNSNRRYAPNEAWKRFHDQYEEVNKIKQELASTKKVYEDLVKKIENVYGPFRGSLHSVIERLKSDIQNMEERRKFLTNEINIEEKNLNILENTPKLNWITALYRPKLFKELVRDIKELKKRIDVLKKDNEDNNVALNSLKNLLDDMNVNIKIIDRHPDSYSEEVEKDNEDSMVYLSNSFYDDLSKEANDVAILRAHRANPWTTKRLNKAREFLFFAALEYVYSAVFFSAQVKKNIKNYMTIKVRDDRPGRTINFEPSNDISKEDRVPIDSFSDHPVLNWDKFKIKIIIMRTLHLVFPVVSSTFCSIASYPLYSLKATNIGGYEKAIQNNKKGNGPQFYEPYSKEQLEKMKPGIKAKYKMEDEKDWKIEPWYLDIFGTVIVDEAGQAMPHQALGALIRAKRAIIVGDPLQIPPVNTGEEKMVEEAAEEILEFRKYYDGKNSVQTVADSINPFGGYLNTLDREGNYLWLGSPLSVHTRCIEPMFSISNRLCYDLSMIKATSEPKDKTFLLDKSRWIDVKGEVEQNYKHVNIAQAEKLVECLREYKKGKFSVYMITPFIDMEMYLSNYLSNRGVMDKKECEKTIGTVHKFQGQQADEVFLVLGCGNSTPNGTYSFVSNNIINVAVTRAKYRFYVIGDKEKWTAMNDGMKYLSMHLQ